MSDRPLFDPFRIRAPDDLAAPPPSTPGTVTVRQVNEMVRGAINRHVPATLHVLGEIGDLSRPTSGHIYFTLKDSASELRAVMWRSSAIKLRFQPEAGMQVIATGGVEVYTPRGAYQLIVRKLEPRGVGALEVAFRQLKEKLEREGLFDAGRKRPLPRIPTCVALMTSPSGAAIRDILRTLERRFPAIEVLVFPVRVQGEGAAHEIADALALANRHRAALGGIDVAIVGRGGGSLEDLWAFNEEIVARAIAASEIPIVSAVGHEIDVTISDLVADVRAATPTAAAEIVAPSRHELSEIIRRQEERAERDMRHAMELARAQLERARASEWLARPVGRLRERAQQVDETTARLRLALLSRFRDARDRITRAQTAIARFGAGRAFADLSRALERRLVRLRYALSDGLIRRERRLAQLEARLGRGAPLVRVEMLRGGLQRTSEFAGSAAGRLLARVREALESRIAAARACDPRRVLARGYSVTRDARSGRVIESVAKIREGQLIETELRDGRFRSTAHDSRQRFFDFE
ncbi:MAG: exodeoxyribonuclease VII large subunit [Phycisphaerae bacterium]